MKRHNCQVVFEFIARHVSDLTIGELIPEVLPRSSGTNVFILFCVSVCSFLRRHALYFSLIFWALHCFQKIVYFAFMYVCIHWLMDGWTYWLCGCVWIQATLGTQRTACKSHFSPSTMWASGVKLRLLGWVVWTLTHSFIVFAFFYCFMFHLGESFLSLSFWQKWYIPLKKFFSVLAPSQLDLNLWHYQFSFVHIYLNTYGPTRVGDRHPSLWPYYIIWSRG